MKKHSFTSPALTHPHRSARHAKTSSALAATLAGLLAFGGHGTLFAATDGSDAASNASAEPTVRHSTLPVDDSDATGGGDAKDKKAVVEKKPDARVKFSVFVEGGITGNPNSPDDHQNFGRVFDDRPNEPMLNQATATVERVLVPVDGQYDWGFKLQAGYGSDGRFINTLGTLENVTRNIVQPYVVEAYGNFHAPIADTGGIDFKFGQFATILGAETIDPRSNYFYSHDYIFNFGIPLQHLGGLLTFHATSVVDIYGGVTRGANTSIYDNNGKIAFLGGLGFNNLLNNKLTLLFTTSIGPENARETFGTPALHGNGKVEGDDSRIYMDGVATYKVTDKLTSISEGVYTYDQGFDTDFFGAAETLGYALNDKVTIAFRGECVHDSDGFYVAQFAANDDFTNAERGGIPLDPRTVSGGENTYFEGTLGVQVKPLKFLTLRPEVRYDYGTRKRAFDDNEHKYSVTIAADAIIAF